MYDTAGVYSINFWLSFNKSGKYESTQAITDIVWKSYERVVKAYEIMLDNPDKLEVFEDFRFRTRCFQMLQQRMEKKGGKFGKRLGYPHFKNNISTLLNVAEVTEFSKSFISKATPLHVFNKSPALVYSVKNINNYEENFKKHLQETETLLSEFLGYKTLTIHDLDWRPVRGGGNKR